MKRYSEIALDTGEEEKTVEIDEMMDLEEDIPEEDIPEEEVMEDIVIDDEAEEAETSEAEDIILPEEE